MIDEKIKHTGEEEYQFPNAEASEQLFQEEELTPEHYEEIPTQTGGLVNRLRDIFNRRILLVLAGAVVIFIAGKIFLGVESQKPKVISKAPVTQQAVTTTVSSSTPQVLGQINQLQQAAINNEASIKQIQSQMSQLESSVSNAQNTEQQLNQSVNELMQRVQALTAKVDAKPKLVEHTKPAGPTVQYHLIAVVPGRAWIESSDGDQMTVRVGDYIKQYGVVKAIDAKKGFVMTHDGNLGSKLINYGQDDS